MEYVSTFITGFQDVVAADFSKRFSGVKIINLFDGLIHYSFSGNSRDLEKVEYLLYLFLLEY